MASHWCLLPVQWFTGAPTTPSLILIPLHHALAPLSSLGLTTPSIVFSSLQCAPGGCLMELCIQLSIIMLGKQLIQNNIFEIGVPYVTNASHLPPCCQGLAQQGRTFSRIFMTSPLLRQLGYFSFVCLPITFPIRQGSSHSLVCQSDSGCLRLRTIKHFVKYT